MISSLTLLVLRIGFLLLLWFFVFAIVYALRSDLFGQRVKRLPTDAQGRGADTHGPAAAQVPRPAAAAGGTAGIVMQHPPLASRSAASATGQTTPQRAQHPPATTSSASHLVITSGAKQGTAIDLGRDPITIGRSAESGLIIRDDYTSTHHARIMLWNDTWMLQDLDSTNGTFLDGSRIGAPTRIPLDTPIKIGTTTFELRR